MLKPTKTFQRLPSSYKKGLYPGYLQALKEQEKLSFDDCIELTYELLFNLANFSLTEVRVMMYIWLRTIGFCKRYEAIEYQHFLDGFRRKDGTRLDSGALNSKSKLASSIKSLKSRNLITQQKDVGRNKVIYSINFDEIKKLNSRYDQKRVKFKRGKAINAQTAHRLLRDFLVVNLGNMDKVQGITSIELKLWLFSYGSSQLWGEVGVLMYRSAFLLGYQTKLNGIYMLAPGVSRNSVYKGLERLDGKEFFDLYTGEHLDLSHVICNKHDSYIANALKYQEEKESNRIRPMNYRQYRAQKKIRRNFLYKEKGKIEVVKSVEKVESENDRAVARFEARMLNKFG